MEPWPLDRTKWSPVSPAWSAGLCLRCWFSTCGDVGHAHGRTGVAALGLLYRIDTEHTQGIGHATPEFL